jgi:hypothetical protein
MEDLVKQNEAAATEMVGNEPLDISTSGEDMPQDIGMDNSSGEDTTDTAAAVEEDNSTPL